MSTNNEKNPILTILLIFNTSIVCFLLYNQYVIQDSVKKLTDEWIRQINTSFQFNLTSIMGGNGVFIVMTH